MQTEYLYPLSTTGYMKKYANKLSQRRMQPKYLLTISSLLVLADYTDMTHRKMCMTQFSQKQKHSLCACLAVKTQNKQPKKIHRVKKKTLLISFFSLFYADRYTHRLSPPLAYHQSKQYSPICNNSYHHEPRTALQTQIVD